MGDGGRHPTLRLPVARSTPKRALLDGINVTSTLVGIGGGVRQVLMVDLTDGGTLGAFLQVLGHGP